jgi:hypothetical protein
VKHRKPPNGQNRDRNYWEPPRSALQLEGHIEEISVEEPPPVPPSTRGQVALSLARDRRVRAVAGVGAVVVLVAAVLVGPLAPSSADSSSSPAESPSEFADAGSSASIEATLRPSPTPRVYVPTPIPWTDDSTDPYGEPTLLAEGWPVELTDSYMGQVLVGPDSTVYVDEYDPIGPTGHLRTDWIRLPDGSYSSPVAFGSDGAAYVPAWPSPYEYDGSADYDTVPLWSFDTKGKVRAGWPVDIPADAEVLPGPSGTVYILSPADSAITILGPNGALRATWTASMPGAICGHVIRPDGTLFLAAAPSMSADDCTIRVFTAAGQETTRSSAAGWSGLALAGDGTIVAWGYDLQPAGYSVAQTRIAIIGTDSLPLPGWPVTYEGTASGPAFGPDGTIYVTVLGLGTSPTRIAALDHGGVARPGWPVSLPAGYGAFQGAQPPVIGAGGTVHCAAVDRSGRGYVLGLDATGATVPGWPYQLPSALPSFDDAQPTMYGSSEIPNPSPMFVRGTTGSGLLYLVLEDRIVALNAEGKVAPGWPFVPQGNSVVWSAALPAPDGGLIVVSMNVDEEGYGAMLLRRLTSAGKTPK